MEEQILLPALLESTTCRGDVVPPRLGKLSRCFCNHLFGHHKLRKLKNGRWAEVGVARGSETEQDQKQAAGVEAVVGAHSTPRFGPAPCSEAGCKCVNYVFMFRWWWEGDGDSVSCVGDRRR